MHACMLATAAGLQDQISLNGGIREEDGVIERLLFCCPALWSRTTAARLKLAGHHPGSEIRVYYT